MMRVMATMKIPRPRAASLALILMVAAVLPAVAAAGEPGAKAEKVPGIESQLARRSGDAQRARSSEQVIVQVVEVGDATAAIARHGGQVVSRGDSVLSARVPVAALLSLAADPAVAFVFEPPEPHADAVSTGAAFHGADNWHSAGFDGTGVDVMVLDLGFIDYQTAVSPAGGAVGPSCAGGLDAGSSHGTGVAEIVRDVAPGADIHLFRTCSTADGPQIVSYIAAHGIDVVNQSLGYFNTGPLDGSDPLGILSFIDDSVAAGAVWLNSAGNYRLGHWSGTWDDNGLGALDFGPADYIEVHLDEGDRIYLRWDDWSVDLGDCGGCGSTVDLDLYLTDLDGVDLAVGWAVSDDPQHPSAPGKPVERITVGQTGTYRISVRHYPSDPIPPGMQIDLFTPTTTLPAGFRVMPRSLNDPATFESVIAVGAVGQSSSSTTLSTSVSPAQSTQRAYSSEGPTADGRMKPDVAGADCVATQPYTPFCGTSAASPHIAGLAALIIEATGAPPSEIRKLMTSMAVDRGVSGPDNQYGYGVLDLGSAPSGDCAGVAATIIALPGQVQIHGTEGDDVILGNDGSNRIWGFAGADRICGGRKGDVIFPGSGDDWVRGQRGSDRIVFSSGDDTLDGNKGDGDVLDFRSLSAPVDVDLKAGEGWVGGFHLVIDAFERVFGGGGDDVIKGRGADEVLKGYAGDDELHGRGGNDRLYGGSGSDHLEGRTGYDDHLNGGDGIDTCTNGATHAKCEV